MEARDSAHALGLQMQAFYEHYRAGGGAFPQYQPSPLQQQQPSPHQQHQQQQHQQQQHYLHHQHHLHHQQQHQHQQQQQQQEQEQEQELEQQQQHNANRNSLNHPMIHSPAPTRLMNPNPGPHLNPNPNPIPSPVTNINPNSTSGVSACYPPETPPHMMPQAPNSSPPSGVGMSMSPGSGMASGSTPTFKKKRGRPRKYATDGNGSAALVIPLNSAPPAEKKGGRGPSKKAQISTSGTTGQGFTPHVLTVGAGEDITAKIMTFSQHGPWAVCILSANGAISNASLWHSGISSGTVTYEGRFEILSLSGLFLLTEDGATQSRSGGFSVSLAGQDGRVIGGRVAGLLIAATPIQVVVGTFFPGNRKSKARAVNVEGPPPTPPTGGTPQASMPMMDRTQFDASGPVRDNVPAGAAKEEHGAMSLQSADWGFDVETRSQSEQI